MVFLIQMALNVYGAEIRLGLLQFAAWQADLSGLARPALCKLSYADLVTTKVPWIEILEALDQGARRIALILVDLMLVITLWLQQATVKERYRRTFNMDKLLAHNLKVYPCIAPLVNWDKSLLDEPLDSGPWMVARNPLQFAVSHKMIVSAETQKELEPELFLTSNGLANVASPILKGEVKTIFLRAKARQVYCSQLAPRYKGRENLPGYLLALGTAFILFGLDRKDEAYAILDQLSLSFRKVKRERKFRWKWPCWEWQESAADYTLNWQLHLSQQELESLWTKPEVIEAIAPHNRYEPLVILGLYDFARRKGVLNTAEFIWLKVINRELFYLCNNWGRRTAWVEIAGAWSHFAAEKALRAKLPTFQGVDLEDKLVEPAVIALDVMLHEQGWINIA